VPQQQEEQFLGLKNRLKLIASFRETGRFASPEIRSHLFMSHQPSFEVEIEMFSKFEGEICLRN
jgi:hypothetical protein